VKWIEESEPILKFVGEIVGSVMAFSGIVMLFIGIAAGVHVIYIGGGLITATIGSKYFGKQPQGMNNEVVNRPPNTGPISHNDQ
jgi:hypothetical protein